jgi:secondary thiamine-phosphate synthase enzyme
MKSKTEYLTFNTKNKRAFMNITPDVRKIVQHSKIKEGLCLVNAMHITASVFINENERGLHGDFDIWLEKLAPHSPTEQYRHNDTFFVTLNLVIMKLHQFRIRDVSLTKLLCQ